MGFNRHLTSIFKKKFFFVNCGVPLRHVICREGSLVDPCKKNSIPMKSPRGKDIS